MIGGYQPFGYSLFLLKELINFSLLLNSVNVNPVYILSFKWNQMCLCKIKAEMFTTGCLQGSTPPSIITEHHFLSLCLRESEAASSSNHWPDWSKSSLTSFACDWFRDCHVTQFRAVEWEERFSGVSVEPWEIYGFSGVSDTPGKVSGSGSFFSKVVVHGCED